MTRAEFERLVVEATTLIPKRFRREMKNLAVVVEDEPSPELLYTTEDNLEVAGRNTGGRIVEQGVNFTARLP